MARYRVREVYKVKGWSYVEAISAEEALKKLEDGAENFEKDPMYFDWIDTDWDTLEEVV